MRRNATQLAATSNAVVLSAPISLFTTTCLYTRDLKPYISLTSAKDHLLQGDNDTISLVRTPIAVALAPDIHNSRRSRPPPLMTSSAFMCRSWLDRRSCTHATPIPLATSLSHAHSKYWNARYGSLHHMVSTTLPQVSGAENLSPNYSLVCTLHPLAQQPWNIR